MAEYSDDELLAFFQTEDKRHYAFNLIVERYQRQVYWHVRKLVLDHDDANDLVQNSFIKVWHNLGSFRGDSKLYTWIYRIATNEALSFLRQKKLRAFVSLDDVANVLADKMSDPSNNSGEQMQHKLHMAILKLPEKQKLVFNMKYFQEMKYEEMSQVLNTSVGALKASFHHAVKKIEEYLKHH